MDTPSKSDLDAVFSGPAPDGAAPLDLPPPPADDSQETEAALDDAIDEIFSTDDPAARREAFKRALELCESKSAGGGGGY